MDSLQTIAGTLFLPLILFSTGKAVHDAEAWADEQLAAMHREYALRWCGASLAADRNILAMKSFLGVHLRGRNHQQAQAALVGFQEKQRDVRRRYLKLIPAALQADCDDEDGGGRLRVVLEETVEASTPVGLPNWHYAWRYDPITPEPAVGDLGGSEP